MEGPKQGSKEWFAQRLGHVTASRFEDTMGKGRGGGFTKTAESYMCELIAEHLTGQPAEEINAKALEWGHKHEPSARSLYTFIHGVSSQQTGFVKHPSEKWVGGSPDSLVGEDGILEIKCPFNSRNHIRTLYTKVIPEDYEAQVQGNLWVTGRKWCDYLSFDPRMPEQFKLVVIRVERDDNLIDHIADSVRRFRDQLIKTVAKLNGSLS